MSLSSQKMLLSCQKRFLKWANGSAQNKLLQDTINLVEGDKGWVLL